jgi:hypothetical protein
VELEDLAALRHQVALFVGDLLKEHAQEIWQDQDWHVEATDADGLILFTMSVFASDTAATMPRRHR